MPNYKYQSDNGDVKPIRLAATTAAAAGTAPTGALDDNDFVKVSKSNREFGMRPRMVRLSRNIGTAAAPNIRYRSLPVLTRDAFNSAAFNIGSEVTIAGNQWQIVGKMPEDV